MQLLDPITFSDFSGGVNFGTLGISLKENELAFAQNLKPVGRRLRTRGGLRRMAVAPSLLTGFTPAERAGEWVGLAFQSDQIGYFHGPNLGYQLIALTADTNLNDPWITAEWQSTHYAVRPDSALLMIRMDPDIATNAGISAPGFTAVAADGGAGVLSAANYQYVFSYGDSASGAESSYGPVSNTLALGANRQIALTGLVASTNPRVDVIHIYRTLPGGTGLWLRVATIPHTQTTYTDNIPVTQQGVAASATNGLPPTGVVSVAVWQGRLWVTDGQFLYPSKLLNPDAFDPAQALQVGTPSDEIAGLLATEEALVIGRRKGMSYLTGTGATSWVIREADDVHGLVGPAAITKFNKTVVWISYDGPYTGTGMSEGRPFGVEQLRRAFQLAPGVTSYPNDTTLRRIQIAPCVSAGGVIFNLPQRVGGGFYNFALTVFGHLETRSWWPWAFGPLPTPPIFYSSGIGPDGRTWTWTTTSTDQSALVQMDDESYFVDDASASIEDRAVIITRLAPRFIDFGARKALIHEVRVEMSAADVLPADVLADGTNDVGIPGNVDMYVHRQVGVGFGQQIQPTRSALASPKRANGLADAQDNWRAYRIKTNGASAIPSNTLGLLVDFPAIEEPFLVTYPNTPRPIWIGSLQLVPLVTDLSEKVS